MLQTNINILAVLASSLAAMVIGYAWYSPLLFGRIWIRASGRDTNDKEQMAKMMKDTGKMYGKMFLANLVNMVVLGIFLRSLAVLTIVDSLLVAFVIWIGFMATMKYGDTLFAGQNKTMALIDVIYQLVTILASATIFFYLG